MISLQHLHRLPLFAPFLQLAKKTLRSVGVNTGPSKNPLPAVLQSIFKASTTSRPFTIIQIGAYIGNSGNDPLFKSIISQLKANRGTLICVEPDPGHFDALQKNYAGIPNVVFVNAAIAETSEQKSFFKLNVDPVAHGRPEWLSQLGSLKKERMETLWDQYESNSELKQFYLDHRIEITVNCLTLQDLLQQHQIKSIDLLQIDTEGYELEILSSIDFAKIPRPRYINYESVLLNERKSLAEQILLDQNYLIFHHGVDTLCYQAEDTRIITT